MERFWLKVAKTDDCWLWVGAKSSEGYGSFRLNDKAIGAHRVAYELLVGPIPHGLTIDHLCKVRHCVNPAHLEPVTMAENVRRAHWQETCIYGHALIERGGRRVCRQCQALASRRYRQQKQVNA